jgi:Domain of unknown function (DUF4126)
MIVVNGVVSPATMDALPLVLTGGWAAGINCYLAVLLTGVLGRLDVAEVPNALERTDVLVAAAVMYAIEFVADKIPYVDNTWDAISTAIRPTVGAILGALAAGEAGSLSEAVGAATGGTTALVSHGVKAGLRVAINASPEPMSNIGASVAEDSLVAGVVLLAIEEPWLAATVALLLLAAGAALLWWLRRKLGRWLAGPRGP